MVTVTCKGDWHDTISGNTFASFPAFRCSAGATESKKIGPHQKGNKGNDDEQSSKEKVTKGNGRKIIFWTKQKKNINTTDVTEY